MRPFIYAAIAVCVSILSSCSKYQGYHTASTNVGSSNSQYVYENDTVRISYDFWESKGIMRYTVYNKIDIPIYVDWKNSAFIKNDDKRPYWEDVTQTKASGTAYSYKGLTVASGKSTAVKDERVTSIPPRSKIMKETYRLVTESVKDPKRKGAIYEYSTSPLRYRNFIVISIKEDLSAPFYVDNEFWVNKVIYFRPGKGSKDKREFYFGP